MEYQSPKFLTVSTEDTDSVVFSIMSKFKERSRIGMEKYGTNLDRNDLSVLDWIQHAQEEHMDAILYLEKLKQEITKITKNLGKENQPENKPKNKSHSPYPPHPTYVSNDEDDEPPKKKMRKA